MFFSKIRSILAVLVIYTAAIVGCFVLYPYLNIPGVEGQAILIKVLLLVFLKMHLFMTLIGV